MVLIQLLERVHILVRVHPLPNHQLQFVSGCGATLLPQILELVDSSFAQVVGECLKAASQELQGILEDQVPTKGEDDVLLHPLPDYLDLLSSITTKG